MHLCTTWYGLFTTKAYGSLTFSLRVKTDIQALAPSTERQTFSPDEIHWRVKALCAVGDSVSNLCAWDFASSSPRRSSDTEEKRSTGEKIKMTQMRHIITKRLSTVHSKTENQTKAWQLLGRQRAEEIVLIVMTQCTTFPFDKWFFFFFLLYKCTSFQISKSFLSVKLTECKLSLFWPKVRWTS